MHYMHENATKRDLCSVQVRFILNVGYWGGQAVLKIEEKVSDGGTG